MHIRTILPVLLLLIGGCSSVPSVKLTPESFNQLQTARLESAADNNLMLQAISTVDVVPTGVGTGVTGSAGDGLGVRTFALQFMDRHQISLNKLVRTQFEEKLRADNLALRITDGSPNRLVLTLNVVVLGMKHGFSDEFNALFNIAGQLYDANGQLLWSYNAIPMPPAPGYSATAEQIFASGEAMMHYLSAASEPMVEKLYKHFSKELKKKDS